MEVVGDVERVYVVGCETVTVSSRCVEMAHRGSHGAVAQLWLYGG